MGALPDPLADGGDQRLRQGAPVGGAAAVVAAVGADQVERPGDRLDEARPLTCSAARPEPPLTFTLLDLRTEVAS